MERTPEPELMDEPEQARAYAQADFEQPHSHFMQLFAERFGDTLEADVLDLGCGPGDISRRFARRYPRCRVHGVDGASVMLELARSATLAEGLAERVEFVLGRLPGVALPRQRYQAVISNSLLHHLQDPDTLWGSVREFGASGAIVFVMDLLRPADRAQARQLVHDYAAGEPAILQSDFFNSLLAAWRPEEVRQQLRAQGLEHLAIETVSDRHFIVFGRLR